MNSDDLATFLRIAETGSLSRCAIETGLSQSVLSRKITALETYLGTRLFYRSGRGVVLTEHGRRLAVHAQRVIGDLSGIERDMAGTTAQCPTSITVAAQPTVARVAFGAIGKALQLAFPGIRIRFREGLGGHIQEWLSGGEIDIALLYLGTQHPHADADVLLREHLSFVTPGDFGEHFPHGFPSNELGSYPLVLPSPPHGLRTLAQTLVSAAGQTLHISMECDASVYITRQLVADGCGCTILPLAAVREDVASGRLKAYRLVNPEVVREVALVCSQNRPPVMRQWDVLQLIRQQIHQLVENNDWPDAEPVPVTTPVAARMI